MKTIGALILLATSHLTHAAILDFEGMDTGNGTYSADGYDFVFNFAGWFISDSSNSYYHSYNNNGTAVLGGQGSGGYVDISMTDGSIFGASSFDAATFISSFSSGSLDVIGTLSGGGSVSQNFDLTTTFTDFSLASSFTGLSSIRFMENGGSSTFATSAGLVIDNVDFGGVSATVPEPPVIALFGLGLLGAGFARKRRTH